LALLRKKKEEILGQYKDWLAKSRAVVLTEYTGLSMKNLDQLRQTLREAGGEFHVVKNTLGKIAFSEAGYPVKDEYFTGSTGIGFAFEDAPALAKAMTAYAKDSPFVHVKGGYLGSQMMDEKDIQALADLPPLPIMRAILLGTLMAPASKLARTLAEPGRSLAAVIQAYADKDAEAVE